MASSSPDPAAARLAALARQNILDTPREAAFDEIASLAARICDVPVALVSFVADERQWFKAEVGLGTTETPINQSICAHAMHAEGVFEVPDLTADPRTADNTLVTGDPHFRYYAGAPLTDAAGQPLGALCVLDHRTRTLDQTQRDALLLLARLVMRQLDLRQALAREDVLRREIDHRVKNSLQSVAAIVHLQASAAEAEETRIALSSVAARIGTIAALHEQLHQAKDTAAVELADYLPRIARMLTEMAPEKLVVTATTDALPVDSSVASGIGAIVNEFVANTLKYAAPVTGKNRVAVEGRVEATGYRLTLTDNGATGDAALAAVQHGRGLGTRIIAAATRTLGATATWSAPRGLCLTLDLPAA